jgi:RimJ/RimL family protein N-acetyltransferase
MLKLDTVEWHDTEKLTDWRKANPEGARTPYMLSYEQEDKWYRDVVCDRNSPHRYWAVRENDVLVGLTGITNIEHENRRGEVALLIDPEKRGRGFGREALWLALGQAFDNMDLEQVYGECYKCNGSLAFWANLAFKHGWEVRVLPSTKRWGGKRWDSLWFAISAGNWQAMRT